MKEIENYKYLFFKKIYDILELDKVEQQIIESGIQSLSVINNKNYDTISHFFFLLNEFKIDLLNNQELKQFYSIFSKSVNLMNGEELKNAEQFIENTYKKVFFSETNQKNVYYGPINYKYLSPYDAIALGLYYDALNDIDFVQENKLCELINFIQFELAPAKKLKVAVILYNQLTLDNVQSKFSK